MGEHVQNTANPITVCWISDFALEWLDPLPESLRHLHRGHPMTWQAVLLDELRSFPGLRLHVIALRKRIPHEISFERDGVQFHALKTIAGTRASSVFWIDTLLIKAKLAQINPSVVHAWGTERGAGLVASRMKYPYFVTMQGLLNWYQEVTRVSLLHRFSAIWERVTLQRASLATTESRFAVDFLKQRHPGLDVRQVEHAPKPIFHNVHRSPQTDPIRFIFIGSFEERKGADLLLKALDVLRCELQFEVMVIGTGAPELKAKLGASVSEALWGRIQFRKSCTPNQVAEELSKATMMIFPTRADTSPNAVKEAVVAGVPVIASCVGGIPDYVIPNKNGLLCRSGDLEQLVNTIREGCSHPLFGKGKVDETTLAQTRVYLSPKTMAEKFTMIYRELAATS